MYVSDNFAQIRCLKNYISDNKYLSFTIKKQSIICHINYRKDVFIYGNQQQILEEYFSCLTVIKARLTDTISEFRFDLRLLFKFVYKKRKPSSTPSSDCSFADIKFIKSITLDDMYSFVTYLQKD